MCSCDDSDPPRVFERVLRKARRGYACCECVRRIQHGDWYEEVRGLWESSWDTFRSCTRCTARRMAWVEVECHPPFTQLLETIRECLVANDYDGKRMVRRIDRVTGREYVRALRAARSQLHGEIALLEQQRAERYAEAGRQRELAKWRAAHIWEGI